MDERIVRSELLACRFEEAGQQMFLAVWIDRSGREQSELERGDLRVVLAG